MAVAASVSSLRVCNKNQFPSDTLAKAFEFLQPDDLAKVAGVSKHWQKLSSQPHLWIKLVEAFGFDHLLRPDQRNDVQAIKKTFICKIQRCSSIETFSKCLKNIFQRIQWNNEQGYRIVVSPRKITNPEYNPEPNNSCSWTLLTAYIETNNHLARELPKKEFFVIYEPNNLQFSPDGLVTRAGYASSYVGTNISGCCLWSRRTHFNICCGINYLAPHKRLKEGFEKAWATHLKDSFDQLQKNEPPTPTLHTRRSSSLLIASETPNL